MRELQVLNHALDPSLALRPAFRLSDMMSNLRRIGKIGDEFVEYEKREK